MTLEDGYHDVGGVLDGEIPGPGPDRGHREAREFPLARLFQRRAPRARHPVAGHWLGVASDDGVDHELRRQVAATGGGRSGEHTAELQARLQLLCPLFLLKKKKKKYNTYCPRDCSDSFSTSNVPRD